MVTNVIYNERVFMIEEWSMAVGIQPRLVKEHPSTSFKDLDNYACLNGISNMLRDTRFGTYAAEQWFWTWKAHRSLH